MEEANNTWQSIDISALNEKLDGVINDDTVREFISNQIGRDELGKLDREWWLDFFLGVSLWGVAAGTIRVNE